MDWTKSYSSTWRVFRVNTDTWADAEVVPNIVEAKVVRTSEGETIESGTLQATGAFSPGYYRIVLTAEQGGEIQRVDVATLLFSQTGGEYNYGVETIDVNGFSVLYPASTKTVLVGEYAPAGVDGAEYAAELLRDSINAPIVVEGAFTLNNHIVHELGTAVITAVVDVLTAGGFVIQVDGRGVVHIKPKPTEPSLVIDNSSTDMLTNGITRAADMSEIPNRYIVIEDNHITIAENNDPESPVSYITRGYHVDLVDTSPTPVNGETYAEYANGKLRELSILRETYEYSREYAPDVYPYSIIAATINGLMGNLVVESQTLTCSYGIVVSERVAKEVRLYG